MNERQRMTRERRREQAERCLAVDMTVKEWCELNGVSTSTMYSVTSTSAVVHCQRSSSLREALTAEYAVLKGLYASFWQSRCYAKSALLLHSYLWKCTKSIN